MDIRAKCHDILEKVSKPYQIGIITALPHEFAAVRKMLDNEEMRKIPGDPNIYYIGTIPSLSSGNNKKHHIVATKVAKMGNNSAASAATNLLRSYLNIKDVLMVGIAGGIPNPDELNNHVRLGDIVVSRGHGIVQYDNQKLSEGGIKVRDTSTPPSARMTSIVDLLESNWYMGLCPWESHIKRAIDLKGAIRSNEESDIFCTLEKKFSIGIHPIDPDRRKGYPKIHYGLIGSANTLLKDESRRNYLRDTHGIKAIEMEGSGIADGTWTHGAQYLIIRGICDYCDDNKNDLWQPYAAVAAAAYARALIEMVPIDH